MSGIDIDDLIAQAPYSTQAVMELWEHYTDDDDIDASTQRTLNAFTEWVIFHAIDGGVAEDPHQWLADIIRAAKMRMHPKAKAEFNARARDLRVLGVDGRRALERLVRRIPNPSRRGDGFDAPYRPLRRR